MKALKITWMGQSRRNALSPCSEELVEVEQDVKVPILVLDIAVELADNWVSSSFVMRTRNRGISVPW